MENSRDEALGTAENKSWFRRNKLKTALISIGLVFALLGYGFFNITWVRSKVDAIHADYAGEDWRAVCLIDNNKPNGYDLTSCRVFMNSKLELGDAGSPLLAKVFGDVRTSTGKTKSNLKMWVPITDYVILDLIDEEINVIEQIEEAYRKGYGNE